MKRILVAGIGNVFLHDDGFGVAVAQRLAALRLPDGTRVVDFGIRGVHLVFELLEPLDLFVLVDAVSRGAPPGTLCLLDPEIDLEARPSANAHAMDPSVVLSSVLAMGARLPPTRIVGCEPAEIDEGMGLSEPVEQAIAPAVAMVRGLIGSRESEAAP